MADTKALQLTPEGTSELSPIVCGHPFRHTRAHETLVEDSMGYSLRSFVRDGSEFRGFGDVFHHQAYECQSGAFYGELGLGAPSPYFHRLLFDLTQRKRPSQVNVSMLACCATASRSNHPQRRACCGTPRPQALAAARTSARVLHGQDGMDHHTTQIELGECGGALPHGRRLHRTSGNTSHHPALLSAVGASTLEVKRPIACVPKQHVSIDLSSKQHKLGMAAC